MNRRTFLRATCAAALPAPAVAAGYGLFEAGWVRVDRQTLPLPRLPAALAGTRVVFLTDLHHGPFTPLDYVVSVVRTALDLRPDLVLLGGDYSHRDGKYVRPCFEVLSALRAPLGVYGVLGNHDYWHGLRETVEGMRAAGVGELTNSGVWVGTGGARLRVGGVDDLWAGQVDVAGAVGDATADDACLLVSHNPDVAETLRDRRVGLVLSGHTHGGQVVFPGGRAPFVPSAYGRKYLRGLVEAPATRVYVSRGLGTSGLPVRFGSRPEINVITLEPA
ncbi:MAG: metallophosphoesterase [Isosphaera sp.]|nr:metallophosphoesterase [Isosphaera sp.]